MVYRPRMGRMGMFAQDRDAPVTAEERAMAEAMTAQEPPILPSSEAPARGLMDYQSRRPVMAGLVNPSQSEMNLDPVYPEPEHQLADWKDDKGNQIYRENIPLDPIGRRWHSSYDVDGTQMEEARQVVFDEYPSLREFDIQVQDRRNDPMQFPREVSAEDGRIRARQHGSLEFWGRDEGGRPVNRSGYRRQSERSHQRPDTELATSGPYAGGYIPKIEVYQEIPDLPKALVGDMLHHISEKKYALVEQEDGSEKWEPTDEYVETRGVAPKFQKLLDKLIDTQTDRQKIENRQWYERSGDERSYEQWWAASARDAFVRGYLAPDERDEWRRQNRYTGEQRKILDEMDDLLRQGAPD